jgi:hypothetical protein
MRGAPRNFKKASVVLPNCACWAGLLLDQQVAGDDERLVGIGEGGLVTHQ